MASILSHGQDPKILHGENQFATVVTSLVIVAIVLLALFGPVMSVNERQGSGGGNTLRQSLYFFAFFLSVIYARPDRKISNILVIPLSLTIAIIWCWISIIWSISFEISLRRLALTTMLIFTIFLCVDRTGPRLTIALIRNVLLAVLLINFVGVLLFPSIGVHRLAEVLDPALAGTWRGFLGHKNFAGAATAVTILILIFCGKDMHLLARLIVFAASCVFLIGTGSKTSMGILAFAIIGGALFRLYNPKYRAFLIPLISLFVASFTILSTIKMGPLIDDVMYNPRAFTGRTEIWAPLLRYLWDHPFLGSGFGAFWNIGGGKEPIYSYATGWVTVQSSGHNGYIDLAVQVGIPGLLLGIIALFLAPFSHILLNRNIDRSVSAFCAAMLTFVIGHNFTESSLFERDIIVHVFLIFTIAIIRGATPKIAKFT